MMPMRCAKGQGLSLKGVTKKALSKSYRKFPYVALIELEQQVVSRFTEQVPGTRWDEIPAGGGG